MDTIRFRAWDRYANRWITDDENIDNVVELKRVSDGYHVRPASPRSIVMMCTDMRDRDGVLIYEGDIITLHFPGNPADYLEVVYSDGRFLQKNGRFSPDIWYEWDEMKIKGNVYENEYLRNEVRSND